MTKRPRIIESESDFDPSEDDDESVVNDLVSPHLNLTVSRGARTQGSRKQVSPTARKSNGKVNSKRPSTSSASSHASLQRLSNGAASSSSRSIASFVGPAYPPDILCAFCQGTAERNLATQQPEVLISCVECGSSGHPSCMKWGRNPRKIAVAQEYNWRCMECKTCEICCEKGDDELIMFCDRCDRGWHLYCLNPPLSKPPKGMWTCPTCQALGDHVSQTIASQKGKASKKHTTNGYHHHHQALINSPLSSSFGAWEAGPNIGSTSLNGNSRAAIFEGPLRASSPLEMEHDEDGSPQTKGAARMMGKSRRMRKPTDLDRSFELSASPLGSETPKRRDSDSKSLKRGKDRDRAKDPASQSMVIRLKLSAKHRLEQSGRGLGKGKGKGAALNGKARNTAGSALGTNGTTSTASSSRARQARPTSLAMPNFDFENDDQDGDSDDSGSSVPTPRGLSPSNDEETDEDESDEDEPFGGIIRGSDADTSKTVPAQEDKDRFERSRMAAETKLGGAVSNLAGSLSGRIIKRPGHAAAEKNPNASSSGYFTGSPWAGTGTGGDKVIRRGAKGPLGSGVQSTEPSTPGTPLSSAATGAETGKAIPIKTIRFADFDIDTWYQAPYPEEYSLVPDGRLWICEQCFKYMKSRFMASRHRMKCKMRHPPGAEIYRDGNVSVFEVDGRKNKIYCQNLCLLAKMFLDHKTLYYDVEPFLFYVVCEVDEIGAHFVGYFSKEKRSPLNYNLSCIMTLPIRQRRGWGNFLIDLSYLLSKKEEQAGSPEKPLSDLGLLSYRNYWTLAVFYYLRSCSDYVSLEDISAATAMTLEDVFYVLREQDMITVSDGQNGRVRAPATSKYKSRESGVSNSRPIRSRAPSSTAEKDKESTMAVPSDYSIHFDRDYVIAHIKNYESKGYMKVKPESLHWAPFLLVRTLGQTSAETLGDIKENGRRATPSLSRDLSRDAIDLDMAVNGVQDSKQADGDNNADREMVLLHDPGQPDVVVPSNALSEVEINGRQEADIEDLGADSGGAAESTQTPVSSTQKSTKTLTSPLSNQSSPIRRRKGGRLASSPLTASSVSPAERKAAIRPSPRGAKRKSMTNGFDLEGPRLRNLRHSNRVGASVTNSPVMNDASSDADALGSDDPTWE